MAKRTVVERGWVSATGSHEPYGDPATLDSLLLNLINIEIELVKRDKTWLDCIVMCVVPRYAEELILVELYVEQNHRGMTNKQLFEALTKCFSEMTARQWNGVLQKMLTRTGSGMVRKDVLSGNKLKIAAKGLRYIEDAFEFPRGDVFGVVMDTIGCMHSMFNRKTAFGTTNIPDADV